MAPSERTARAAITATEESMGSAVFASREGPDASLADRVAAAADALRAAGARARGGERAAVLVGTDELAGALALEGSWLDQAGAGFVVHVLAGAAPAVRGPHPAMGPALAAGVIVLSTWTVQDAVDTALAARRAAEDSHIPILHLCDVPGASTQPVEVPAPPVVGAFLAGSPGAGAGLGREEALGRAPFAVASALREVSEKLGRVVAPVVRVGMLDADEVLVAFGATVPAAFEASVAARDRGRRVGVVALRVLRPFLGPELVKATSRARAIAVLEPGGLGLSPCGRVAADLKSAFADALTWASGYPGVGKVPTIVSASTGSDPSGPRPEALAALLAELELGDRARRTFVVGS